MAYQKKTDQHRERDRVIIERLTRSGWRRTDRSEAFGAADLTYRNQYLSLGVLHEWQDDSITFKIIDKNNTLYLAVYFNDNLPQLLEVISAMQDEISPDNFRDQIGKIIQVCPSVYVDTGDGIVPIDWERPG